jgi:hypothetical protein
LTKKIIDTLTKTCAKKSSSTHWQKNVLGSVWRRRFMCFVYFIWGYDTLL